MAKKKSTSKKNIKSPEEMALQRIDEAIKTGSTELDFSRLGLTAIPSKILQIPNLKSINLYKNDFSYFPIALCQLNNLEVLRIDGNTITEIPKEIENLSKLKSLILGTAFRGNALTALPPQIAKLTKLEIVSISYNYFSKLPLEICYLENLKELFLSHTKIKALPTEFTMLVRLESLGMEMNELDSLPLEITKLTGLKKLFLSKNNFSTLPNELRELKNLTELHLLNNPLPIPPEILGKPENPNAILATYFGSSFRTSVHVESILSIEEKVDTVIRLPLHEAKTLLVGQGSVGKTSLVEQILHGTFDPNQTKTEGISINQWLLDDGQSTIDHEKSSIVNGQSSIKLNIWDFGGQEIMHATHQFFLTKRSLYLLVLDARLTQEENRVEYWLKIIQSFGGESPVLIVGNKADQHPLDIDRTGLQKKYPNIVGILETSAATGAGIDALKAEIAKQVDTLPHVRDLLPETWFTVKSKLEELGRDKNFITQDEYLSLCGENDVADETSQHTLIGFLHDLGVVLHFQDDPRLEALGILNPQWVTNGVYKILNSHELFQSQGILNPRLLNEILNSPEYPRDKRFFIIDMMKKFELCYDIISDKSFLIPDLLPKDEPYTGEWDEALAFQYHYNVLPSSIISRFIVRMNAFVHKTVWRSGVVLKSGGNTALIKADTEDRKIYIWVTGDVPTRRDFLSAIRMEFSAIHKTIAKIEATEKVPLPSQPTVAPVDYEFLLRLERDNRSAFPVQAGNDIIDVDVKELLDGVRPSKNQSVKVFISYGHDDKVFVKNLASDLGNDNIESWWDFDKLKGGHDWQKEIQQGIKRCDFFIVVLTPQSVESEWVNKEITYANEYKKKIIPIRLKDCERPISIIEKQYIDFENQTQKSAIKELLGILQSKE